MPAPLTGGWAVQRAALRCGVVALLLGLGACTTPPGAGGAVGPANPAASAQSAVVALQTHLRREFEGTPVQVDLLPAAAPGDVQALRIAVPQPHGFEPGRSAVRPALAAVLDRLLPALREQTRWTLRTSGPLDARGAAWLATDRASAVRDYLVMRGVAVARFAPPQRNEALLTEVTLLPRVAAAVVAPSAARPGPTQR